MNKIDLHLTSRFVNYAFDGMIQEVRWKLYDCLPKPVEQVWDYLVEQIKEEEL